MSTTEGPDPRRPRRLVSLDALRGFDMVWIVGGREVVVAAFEASGWGVLGWIAGQCEHVPWHGFHLWDLVFPLFLFLAGVSLPFSLAARRARGDDRGKLTRHVLRRGLVLVFLGIVYNGLLAFDLATLRYASVLGRIGLAWMLAALVVLYTPPRLQPVLAAAILLGHWAALEWVPFPGRGSDPFAPGANLNDWIDRALLPGRLHRGNRDPEGILGTLPAMVTALSGVFAGRWLRASERDGRSPTARVAGLVAAGGLLLLAGWLWRGALPWNKHLWTGSFTLWTAGLSCVALAAFHLVVDVWGWRRLAFPFVVLGTNAITIYLLHAFVDFDRLAQLFFGTASPRRLHPALLPAIALAFEWVLLWSLYRRRLFLRV